MFFFLFGLSTILQLLKKAIVTLTTSDTTTKLICDLSGKKNVKNSWKIGCNADKSALGG